MIYTTEAAALNIKLFRTKRKLSQKEVAAKLGVSVTWLSRLETGGTSPSLARLLQLAHVLRATPNDLLLAHEIAEPS